MRAERKVAVRPRAEFGIDLPDGAALLFALASERAWPSLSFAVPALAPSINHAYTQVSRERRVLSAETVTFRQMVQLALRGRPWQPKGVVMSLVFLMQPFWLTKKLTIRDVDADNRLKMLFDAIQLATGVPDHTNWTIHVFKVVTTRKVQTAVWLFDMGEEVDVFHG